MLIGESCDAQSVCFRATDNACPIDVHRDVRVTDLLEGRIEMSMLRADLNVSLKFIAPMSVVDGDHVASLQICCDTVDPIERSLIKAPMFEDVDARRTQTCRLGGRQVFPCCR